MLGEPSISLFDNGKIINYILMESFLETTKIIKNDNINLYYTFSNKNKIVEQYDINKLRKHKYLELDYLNKINQR